MRGKRLRMRGKRLRMRGKRLRMRGKRLKMRGKRLRMRGKRLRMKVLVDGDRLEDQDAIALAGLAGDCLVAGTMAVVRTKAEDSLRSAGKGHHGVQIQESGEIPGEFLYLGKRRG